MGQLGRNAFEIHPPSMKIVFYNKRKIKGLPLFEQVYNAIKSNSQMDSVSARAQSKLKFMTESLNAGKNIWILKPAVMNRGKGVMLFRNIEELKKNIEESIKSREGIGSTATKILASLGKDAAHEFIIQKYIERPLLYKQRKFDLRVWTLVTQGGDIYFCPKIYVRLSGHLYDGDFEDINNQFIHLTNNAVQKNDPDAYGSEEEGNIIPIKTLFEQLQESYPGVNWKEVVLR